MLHQHKRSNSSKSDSWWTPLKTFEQRCKVYNFKPNLDIAASEANSLCKYYIDKQTDALKIHWTLDGAKSKGFLNPPNKLLGKFIDKGFEEFLLDNSQFLMIVPLNVQSSKAWFRSVQVPMEKGYDIFVRPILTRIAFMNCGRGNAKSSINGYCEVLFGFNKGPNLP